MPCGVNSSFINKLVIKKPEITKKTFTANLPSVINGTALINSGKPA